MTLTRSPPNGKNSTESDTMDDTKMAEFEVIRDLQKELQNIQLQMQQMKQGQQAQDQNQASGSNTSNNAQGPLDSTDNHSISAVTIKPPPFWVDNPSLWFAQLETIFALNKLTSDLTKFRYAVANIDYAVASTAQDIIKNPPANNKYETLKQRIINTLSESPETKLGKLIRGFEPGSEKPSIFLQRLRNLADGQVDGVILRSMFLGRLSDNIRSVLAVVTTNDLNELAALADKIHEVEQSKIYSVSAINEVNSPVSSTSQCSNNNNTNGLNATLLEMQKSLCELNKSVKILLKNRNRSRQRSQSASRPTEGDSICYLHRKYGDKARNCQPPCNFRDKSGN